MLITPHHSYNCNCNYTTLNTIPLQLQRHYTTLQVQLHYTTLHPGVVRWPLQPLQPFQKTQLQPPFGPSVDSLCHPWFTTTNLSYRFPIFDTSATALCGTTGKLRLWSCIYIYIYIRSFVMPASHCVILETVPLEIEQAISPLPQDLGDLMSSLRLRRVQVPWCSQSTICFTVFSGSPLQILHPWKWRRDAHFSCQEGPHVKCMKREGLCTRMKSFQT